MREDYLYTPIQMSELEQCKVKWYYMAAPELNPGSFCRESGVIHFTKCAIIGVDGIV